jgi:hypothetical protein
MKTLKKIVDWVKKLFTPTKKSDIIDLQGISLTGFKALRKDDER